MTLCLECSGDPQLGQLLQPQGPTARHSSRELALGLLRLLLLLSQGQGSLLPGLLCTHTSSCSSPGPCRLPTEPFPGEHVCAGLSSHCCSLCPAAHSPRAGGAALQSMGAVLPGAMGCLCWAVLLRLGDRALQLMVLPALTPSHTGSAVAMEGAQRCLPSSRAGTWAGAALDPPLQVPLGSDESLPRLLSLYLLCPLGPQSSHGSQETFSPLSLGEPTLDRPVPSELHSLLIPGTHCPCRSPVFCWQLPSPSRRTFPCHQPWHKLQSPRKVHHRPFTIWWALATNKQNLNHT